MKSSEKWEKVVKSGEKWEKVVKSGEKWEKVGKSGKKWEKVGKSCEMWGKVGKKLEKWGKVGKSVICLEFFTKWPLAAILDDRKSLSIAFLAISDQYANFLQLQNARQQPFWIPIFAKIDRRTTPVDRQLTCTHKPVEL